MVLPCQSLLHPYLVQSRIEVGSIRDDLGHLVRVMAVGGDCFLLQVVELAVSMPYENDLGFFEVISECRHRGYDLATVVARLSREACSCTCD